MRSFARGLLGYVIMSVGTIAVLGAVVAGVALVLICGSALLSVFAR